MFGYNKSEISRVMDELQGYEPSRLEQFKRSVSLLFRNIARKIKYTAAISTGKYLAYNPEYVGAPKVSQEVVEENPRKWIIEECIPACRILWAKNIYTFMCSDMDDKNAWIELDIDNLSDENKMILERIKEEFVTYQYHAGCINIMVPGKGEKASSELVRMAEMFVMQDVPEKEGTVSIDDILIEAGCYTERENPNYDEEMEKWMSSISFDSWGAPMPVRFERVVDRSKMDKTEDEYIHEFGGVKDGDVIYRSRFHFNKHIRYNLYMRDRDNVFGLK